MEQHIYKLLSKEYKDKKYPLDVILKELNPKVFNRLDVTYEECICADTNIGDLKEKLEKYPDSTPVYSCDDGLIVEIKKPEDDDQYFRRLLANIRCKRTEIYKKTQDLDKLKQRAEYLQAELNRINGKIEKLS